jgi:hypothetical protein
MKHTNKITLLALLTVGISVSTLQSCKKYENGPSLSLRSRTERVANVWKIESYILDGSDLTSLTTGYTETYTKDKDFSFSYGSQSGTGKWVFQNDDKEIKVYGIDGQESKIMKILKLEEKSFWYQSTEGNRVSVVHLIPN